MDNLIGQNLGRYHLVEQLGEGGMASVYKAFDTRLDRYVAVKVILSSQLSSETFLKRFEREAKALAKLNHPNIVNIHDYGEDHGIPYLVMAYLPGGTLKSKMGAPIPYSEAARLLLPIAQALDYAHKQQIIHRDIKPANILLTDSGAPMLSDFGIAKVLSGEQKTELTGVGVGIGTPEYMSPEQGQGYNADNRSDIYSLGVVFYELITGRKPFRADTPLAVILKHISEPLPRPAQFVPGLPGEVEGVIFKSLQKDPKQRFQEMNAFATALENLIHQSVTQHGVPLDGDATVLKPRAASRLVPSLQPPAVLAPQSHEQPNQIPKTGFPPATSTAALGLPIQTRVDPPIQTGTVIAQQTGSYTPPPLAWVQPKGKPWWKKWWVMAIAGLGIIAICVILVIGSGAAVLIFNQPTAVAQITEEINTPTPIEATPVDVTLEVATTEVVQNTPVPTAASTRRPSITPRPTQVHSPRIRSKDDAKTAFDGRIIDSIGKRALEQYSDAELNQVGRTLQYTVNLPKSEQLLWIRGWCATTANILDDNLKHLTFSFSINDVDLDLSLISVQRGQNDINWECIYYYLLLDQWPTGKHHLTTIMNILEPINDGGQDFATGAMTNEFTISVAQP